ncbi:hypothetical protein FQR65_LT14113 [Abscondita terminalis]|nr:hypothetical protein FQR65_LT14113 [Abscondita terminalis]
MSDASNAREKALKIAISQIKKQHGEGAVMRLGDSSRVPVDVVSTGSLGLDIALGIGGLPRGRIIEIYGPESSADLLVSQPDTGEQALEIVDMLVRSNAVDIIVVDSVAALTPRAEIEGEMGDSHMGLQARLMSQALRKLAGNIKRSNTLVIFINQIRMKIGVMFGNPETTTGGNALKFYASVRLDIRRTGSIKKGDEIIGNETRVKVVKNKVAPPFRQAEFEILYNQGICHMGEIVDLGVTHGLIDKAGAWYSYQGERIGQGKDNVKQFLKDRTEICQKLETEIRKNLLNKPSENSQPEAPELETEIIE